MLSDAALRGGPPPPPPLRVGTSRLLRGRPLAAFLERSGLLPPRLGQFQRSCEDDLQLTGNPDAFGAEQDLEPISEAVALPEQHGEEAVLAHPVIEIEPTDMSE